MKILFLDDQPLGVHYFRDELLAAKHDVDFVHTVEDAWKKLQAPTYDLLILDISMDPGRYKSKSRRDGMDTGVHFFKEFRSTYPHTPVLVFTSVDVPEILAEFRGQNRVKLLGKLDILAEDLPGIAEAFVHRG